MTDNLLVQTTSVSITEIEEARRFYEEVKSKGLVVTVFNINHSLDTSFQDGLLPSRKFRAPSCRNGRPGLIETVEDYFVRMFRTGKLHEFYEGGPTKKLAVSLDPIYLEFDCSQEPLRYNLGQRLVHFCGKIECPADVIVNVHPLSYIGYGEKVKSGFTPFKTPEHAVLTDFKRIEEYFPLENVPFNQRIVRGPYFSVRP